MNLHGPTPEPALHRPESLADIGKPHPVVADATGEQAAALAGMRDTDALAKAAGYIAFSCQAGMHQDCGDERCTCECGHVRLAPRESVTVRPLEAIMTSLTFTTTAGKVADLVQQLKAGGTVVTQHSATEFSIEGHGIKAEAKFADPQLTVAVLSKPFYVSIAMIAGGISSALLAPFWSVSPGAGPLTP